METLFDLEKKGSRIAVVEESREYSYRELLSFSTEIVSHINKRTLCFILTSNTFAAISGYVGCMNCHIVPVLLDCNLHTDLIRSMIDHYRPEYLWVPEDKEFCSEKYQKLFMQRGYSLWQSNEPFPFSLNEELALLITTSGSTGSPKLVRQSYQNLIANTKSITEYLKITSDERAITSLPMNYVYGLSVINTHLSAGASLVLTGMNCYTPAFWDLFKEKKATSFAGVPFMYEMIDKLNVFNTVELPALKTLTQAGGKLGIELQKKIAEFANKTDRNFVIMYGASEATARMGWLPPEMSLKKIGSMGIAIPGGHFEIIDANGHVIDQPDEIGELVYYGENVTLGYAERGEDLDKGDENKGRLETGDMAKRDSDGYYYVVGRRKRFIKIVGKRINLDELERNLKEQFQTVDIACVGKDDSLRIYITNDVIKQSVDEYIFNVIGISHGLYCTTIITEIPKNSAGKTLYSALDV